MSMLRPRVLSLLRARLASGPTVTVVIPVYNAERFLREALDSVFAQTLPEPLVEVIAVDDGSTDGSLAILHEYARAHAGMRVISIPNSGSAARPRNVALEQARGRYVFFLDADDRLDPAALAAMTRSADRSGVGVVLCKMGAIGDRPVATAVFRRSRAATDFIDSRAYVTLGPTKLFRRSLIEQHRLRFSDGFRLGEDRPFVMAAYLLTGQVGVVADRVYYWVRAREDGGNTTAGGQSPMAHLEANLALAEVIRDGTAAGRRRDLLLARPIVGPGGLRATFGPAFRTLSEADQLRAIERARAFVLPLWTDGLRGHGTAETRILVDLVCEGDREALVEASEVLAARRPLELHPRGQGCAPRGRVQDELVSLP